MTNTRNFTFIMGDFNAKLVKGKVPEIIGELGGEGGK